MEVVKDSPLLKFNPNTIEEVRKELKLDHDEIITMLDNFEEWILKQNHFITKEFSRRYLELSIIYAKGSLERAKKNLDKLCTLKTLLPSFFSKHDTKKQLIDTSAFVTHGTMPRLTKDNYRVYMIKIVSTDCDSSGIFDFYRFGTLTGEYVKIHDYAHGLIAVVDCRDVNIISLVTKINVVDLRNSMSVLMEGYGLRMKGIHILSSSKAIDAFVAVLKQVVSAKIGSRISVHKSLDSLYEIVPKEMLPKDYGGDEMSLKEIYDNWVDVLGEPENVAFFKEIFKARTNEDNRLAVQFNEQILGMPGSFRALRVD